MSESESILELVDKIIGYADNQPLILNHLVILRAQAVAERDRALKAEAVFRDLQAEIGRLYARLEASQHDNEALRFDLQRSQPSTVTQPPEEPLAHIRGLFYASDDSVPFCPRCWEASGRRIHLSGPIPMFNPEVEHWECHTCHAGYSARPNQPFLLVSRRRAQKA